MELKQIFQFIDDSSEQMIGLWKNLVEIESNSADIAGVNEISRHIDTYCNAMGLNTRKYIFENAGSSLIAFNGQQELPGIALMAHMDTVHKKGSFGNEVFKISDGKAYGPGVYDCKGGIVIALLVIRALQYAGYNQRQIKLILSGDEEVAHALSSGKGKDVYTDEIKGCCCAFNCESGPINGDVITRRKGGATFQFTVTGVESHAGNDPLRGASAVTEAARKIVDISEMSDINKILYNCGKVYSDNGVNIVAGKCTFDVGIRFTSNADYEQAKVLLKEIADKQYDSRVVTTVEEKASFHAMELTEKTDKLFNLYYNSCEAVSGEKPNAIYVGGCSDAAYVAQEGIPVLCGVGVKGEYNHSPKEYAVVDSICEQAKKLVQTILSIEEEF